MVFLTILYPISARKRTKSKIFLLLERLFDCNCNGDGGTATGEKCGAFRRLSKNCPTKGFGGRKSVKGNRQGSLSRSITPPQRAKLQNNLPYSYFAILKAEGRSMSAPTASVGVFTTTRVPVNHTVFLCKKTAEFLLAGKLSARIRAEGLQ